MKTNHALLRRTLGCALLAPAVALAQAPAATPPNATPETIVLNPFVVNAAQDQGYHATNSITASRVGRPIIDTPFSISVITGSFLKDTNNTGRLDEAFKYVAGVSGDSRNNNTGPGLFGSSIGTARGFPINAVLRDGMPRRNNFSLRNVDRVEILKGPVSVFFGSAQPGGTINIITARPKFSKEASASVQYGAYLSKWDSTEGNRDGLEEEVTYNDYVSDKVAYRINAFSSDRQGWHDREYSRQTGITPSFIVKPLPGLEIYAQYEHLKSDSNPSGQAPASNAGLYRDYANPPADVLAANGLTADQYRARILGGGNDWWQLSLNARGNNAAAFTSNDLYRLDALGHDIFPASSPFSKPSFSFQGKGHYVDTLNNTFNFETLYAPQKWLSLRYAYLYDGVDLDYISTSATLPRADGRTVNVGTSQGAIAKDLDQRHQLNALFQGKVLSINNQLLVGYDYNVHSSRNENRLYDYTKTNYTVVDATGATLSGINVYSFFDPSLHSTPDMSLVQNGFQPASRSKDWYEAYYASWNGEFEVAGFKVVPAVGYRTETVDTVSYSTSNVRSAYTTKGDSYNYGLTLKLRPGLNLFASTSQNYQPNTNLNATGVGVNRDINGAIVPGLEERTKLNDQTGKGLDLGLKFELLDNRLSGTLSWFRVDRADIQTVDQIRTLNDPRNKDGILYPNASGVLQTVDAGFRPVTWLNTSGVERNEGVELEMFYTPTKNYQLIISFSNIYDSKIVSNSTYSSATSINGIVERDILFNRRLGNSPKYQGGIFNKYTWSSGSLKGFSVGGGVRGQTESTPRFNTFVDSPDFHKGYLVGDLVFGYKTRFFDRPTEMTLSVNNVTDALHSYGNFGYGEPRKVNFSVKTRF